MCVLLTVMPGLTRQHQGVPSSKGLLAKPSSPVQVMGICLTGRSFNGAFVARDESGDFRVCSLLLLPSLR
jgi:hypothetical protein